MSRYSMIDQSTNNSRGPRPSFGERQRDVYLNPARARALRSTPRSSISAGGLHFRIGNQPSAYRGPLRPGEHNIPRYEDIRGLIFRLPSSNASHLYSNPHKWKETTDFKTAQGSYAQTTEFSVPKIQTFMLSEKEAERIAEVHKFAETTAKSKHMEEEGSKVNVPAHYINVLQQSLVEKAKQDVMSWLQEIYLVQASKDNKLAKKEHQKQIELHKQRLKNYVHGSLEVLKLSELKDVSEGVQQVFDGFPEDTEEQKEAKRYIANFLNLLWSSYNVRFQREQDQELDRNQMNPYAGENHIMENHTNFSKNEHDAKRGENVAFGSKKVDQEPDSESQQAWVVVRKKNLEEEASAIRLQADVDGFKIVKKKEVLKQGGYHPDADEEASFSSLSNSIPHVARARGVAKGRGTADSPCYFSDSDESSLSSHESGDESYFSDDQKPAAMTMTGEESYEMVPRQKKGKEGDVAVNSVYSPPSLDSTDSIWKRHHLEEPKEEPIRDEVMEEGYPKKDDDTVEMERNEKKRKRTAAVHWNEDTINPTRKYLEKLRSYTSKVDTTNGKTPNENLFFQIVQDKEMLDLIQKKKVFDKLPKCINCGCNDAYPSV